MGKDSYQARCTFHGDDRPSMSVRLSPIGWTFNCFACGERGDNIAYFMRTRRVDFKAALRELADGRYETPEAPERHRAAFVLACEFCPSRVDVERDDVPLVGVFKHAGWNLTDGGVARCPACVEKRTGDPHWHASLVVRKRGQLSTLGERRAA